MLQLKYGCTTNTPGGHPCSMMILYQPLVDHCSWELYIPAAGGAQCWVRPRLTVEARGAALFCQEMHRAIWESTRHRDSHTSTLRLSTVAVRRGYEVPM